MYVSDSNLLEAAPVRPENVVTAQPRDGSLPDLRPSLQVSEPMALADVEYQVYETVLCKEVCHLLAPQAPRLVKVHVQVPA